MKRKKLIILVVLLIINLGIVSSASIINKLDQKINFYIEKNTNVKAYTHTVYVEVYTTQWCGPCSGWNDNIADIYASGDYDFEYAEFIIQNHDSEVLNEDAANLADLYGVTAIPTSVLDGNYEQLVGNYPNDFPGLLDSCGNRAVSDIDAEMIVLWLGGATINVIVEIENNDASTYNGYIRVPITEKTSRYDTAYGNDYHNGLLDFAFLDEPISIGPSETYQNSITWNGNLNQDGNGDDFGDVTKENLKLILAVFNQNNGYVDETVEATISERPITTIQSIDQYLNYPIEEINGDSTGAIITNVQLKIHDKTSNRYWNGQNWGSNSAWLNANSSDGEWGDTTEEWYLITELVDWIDGNEFEITAKGIDFQGMEDYDPPKETFTYDITPPETSIIDGPTGIIDQGNVTFTWTGTDNYDSKYKLFSSYKLEGYDEDWSGWSIEKTKSYTDLPQGEYNFLVKNKDRSGNKDPTPANQSFRIARAEPETFITNGPGNLINYCNVTFEWIGSDYTTPTEELIYSYKLEGIESEWSTWTTEIIRYYQELADGEYTFSVKTKDTDELEDPDPPTVSFTVDTIPPEIELTKISSNIFKVEILESGSGIDRVDFYLNNELVDQIQSEPYQYELDNKEANFGKNNIKVVAFDKAGNNDSDEMEIYIFKSKTVIKINNLFLLKMFNYIFDFFLKMK